MTSRSRCHWTAEDKLRIIEEARQTSASVSEVCRRHGIAPGQFPGLSARTGYAWEKQACQGVLEALRNRQRGRKKSDPVPQFEAEIRRLRAPRT